MRLDDYVEMLKDLQGQVNGDTEVRDKRGRPMNPPELLFEGEDVTVVLADRA